MQEYISNKTLREFGFFVGIGFPVLVGTVLPLFGGHTSSKKVSIGENNMKVLEVNNLKDLSLRIVIDKIKADLN